MSRGGRLACSRKALAAPEAIVGGSGETYSSRNRTSNRRTRSSKPFSRFLPTSLMRSEARLNAGDAPFQDVLHPDSHLFLPRRMGKDVELLTTDCIDDDVAYLSGVGARSNELADGLIHHCRLRSRRFLIGGVLQLTRAIPLSIHELGLHPCRAEHRYLDLGAHLRQFAMERFGQGHHAVFGHAVGGRKGGGQ